MVPITLLVTMKFGLSTGIGGTASLSVIEADDAITDLGIAAPLATFSLQSKAEPLVGNLYLGPSALDTATTLGELRTGCYPTDIPPPDHNPDAEPRVLLLKRGGCSFLDKAMNCAANGIAAMLVVMEGYVNPPTMAATSSAIVPTNVKAMISVSMNDVSTYTALAKFVPNATRIKLSLTAASPHDTDPTSSLFGQVDHHC